MKKSVVVDTNVPIVANRESPQASPQCVLTCVRRLTKVMDNTEKLVLDDKWQILKEYMAHLRSSGQPGVGDAFLKWVLTNQSNASCCELVAITPGGTGNDSFQEFPSDPALQSFDPSDRKFVAVALAHQQRPSILQAVDTKWWSFRNELAKNGATVDFLCVEDVRRLRANI